MEEKEQKTQNDSEETKFKMQNEASDRKAKPS